jgi:hypothetical protein
MRKREQLRAAPKITLYRHKFWLDNHTRNRRLAGTIWHFNSFRPFQLSISKKHVALDAKTLAATATRLRIRIAELKPAADHFIGKVEMRAT